MRRIATFAILALGSLAPFAAPPAAQAENPGWADIAKQFAADFKAKPGIPIEQRRKAINAVAKANDARGVDLLINVMDDQSKYAGKLRGEWAKGEAEWKEKTDKFEKSVEEKRRQAKERGEDTVEITKEEAEWLGSQSNPNPKMLEAKKQLEARYKGVLAEEGLVLGVVRGMARIVNSLDGADVESATGKMVSAANAAKESRKIVFIQGMGYAKGDRITAFLELMSKDASIEIVQSSLESLGRQNSEKSADVLIAKLDDTRWQVRASAITGLSFFRNGAVVGKVMDALLERGRKEDGVLQRNFFVAMAKITQEEVPATIEAWESWWKANRDDMIKKFSEREGNGLPVEDDPADVLIATQTGSSSFYGITTTSKHIIFVVDVSGSMRVDTKDPNKENLGPDDKSRIMVAREELKKALLTLTATEGDDRGEASFNIVIFSTGVEVYKPGKMIDATKKAKEDAIEWVDKKVVADGNTNIFDGLEQAFNIISATSDTKNLKRGADTIFLMTDGLANRGKFIEDDLILAEIKKLNATRKMTIHTIGVGELHNPTLLRALAAAHGGQYIAR